LLLGISERNEFFGSDPNSIQPLQLFFVIEENIRHGFTDEKPERPRFIEIVRHSCNKLHDRVQSTIRKS
jgi:hypothetical protein